MQWVKCLNQVSNVAIVIKLSDYHPHTWSQVGVLQDYIIIIIISSRYYSITIDNISSPQLLILHSTTNCTDPA